ncbi:MAG: S1-like domain-containing RNA-binding protein [Epsilonproteobacteria bacterium]|nr:S1-like domain-containing RNA-binding protein [Campylobacterota bacterium]
MNEKIILGEINTLLIKRDTDHGFFLVPSRTKEEICEQSETEAYEVLLPNAYITDDMQVGDEIEVFIYTDSEDRLVATTEYPKALINEFAFVKVVDVAPFGAFVDIGLPKHLLVPNNKQKNKFHIGDKRIIRVVKDDKSERLIGIEKITSFLSSDTKHFKKNQEVKVLVISKTPLGFKVIVDNNYEGMIYANEVFCKLFTGDTKKAYIKTIREDGKLDVSLQPIGKNAKKDAGSEKVLELLSKNNDKLPYNYKSEAEDIVKFFNMSKKNFKSALTLLIEANKIVLNETGISLVK